MSIKPQTSADAVAAFLAKGGKVTTVAAASADTVKRSQSRYWRDVRHFNETGETPAQRAQREEWAAAPQRQQSDDFSSLREQEWSEYDPREHVNGDL